MRVLSIVEAATITGPVKPLLMFSELARRGVPPHDPIEHSLLTTARPRQRATPGGNDLVRAAREIGLDVDLVAENFPFDPRVIGRMADAIRRRTPDIVETHDFKSHFLLWLMKSTGLIGHPRWIAFHHGYTRMSRRVLMYQQLDRLSLRHADKVITLCLPFVDQLTARGVPRGRIDVITNAVSPKAPLDETERSTFRRSLGIGRDERLIVSVGRLSREKGHSDLVSAFASLLDDPSSGRLRLILVGDGGERDVLRHQAARLDDRVMFAGHQGDPWPYFCIADVFALPSHSEGSPLVLFEAMSAGVPIVATPVGGVPEVVHDGKDALLVPRGNPDLLRQALARALTEPALADVLGRTARQQVQQYSPERYAQRLLTIYEGLSRTEAIGDRQVEHRVS